MQMHWCDFSSDLGYWGFAPAMASEIACYRWIRLKTSCTHERFGCEVSLQSAAALYLFRTVETAVPIQMTA